MVHIPSGGDLVPTMPRCVCPKVKDMVPFSASREGNECEYFTQNVKFGASLNMGKNQHKLYQNNQKMMYYE